MNITEPLPARKSFAASHLREWRLFVGMPAPTLAARAGTHQEAISRAERRARVYGVTVNRYADALGVPAAVLVAYAPTDKAAQQWAIDAAIRAGMQRLTIPRRGRWNRVIVPSSDPDDGGRAA